MTKHCVSISVTTALIVAGGSGFTCARAQPLPEDASPLPEVKVSARKQDDKEVLLPVATTILDRAQLPSSVVDSAGEIARQSPGTNFVDLSRFGDGYLTMRGVATLGGAQSPLDSTVGFSTNGVPTSISALNAPLLDVEQVEVLRGPQGTTFGRNALGGSINVVTRPADGQREVRLDTEVGTHGHRFGQATVGGFIVPGAVAGRAVVRLQKLDGDIPNTIAGGNDGGSRIGAAHGALRFTPDWNLTIDVTGDYSSNQNHNPSNLLLQSDAVGESYPTSGQDVRPDNLQKIASGSVKVTKELEPFTLTSVTGYQEIRTKSYADFTDSYLYGAAYGALLSADNVPYYISAFNNPQQDKIRSADRERIFNQEVRLNSGPDSPFKWVIGANYFRSAYHLVRDMRTSAWPTLNGLIDNRITSQTWGLFGDATVPLAHQWDISAGARLAHDRQELAGAYTSDGYPGTVSAFSQASRHSDTYLTGRAALTYKWTEEVMSYLSAARGYASGGFEKSTQYAPYGIETEPFKPAKSWTYEIGTKAQLNERVRLGGAFFYNDVRDGQLATFDTATLRSFFTSQDYRSYGVEANATATVAMGLTLRGGFSAISTKLVHTTPESIAAGAQEGGKVPQVPSFAATLNVDYRFNAAQLGLPGQINASANYQHVGTRYSDVANAGKLDAYHLVNTRLSWTRNALTVSVFANNLFDERPVYYAVPVASGVSAAYVGRGRVAGIGVGLAL
jgi:iron complex outermembrane recepter protein